MSVKLRKLLRPVKVGKSAPLFVFCKAISWKLAVVPPKVTGVPSKSLACVLKSTFKWVALLPALMVRPVVLFVAVITPVCVKVSLSVTPFTVRVRLRPMLEVPKISDSAFVTLTSFVPVFVNETAPPKRLF